MISEDNLNELLEEDRMEEIAPEEKYCEGCGCILNEDTKEKTFCARCE